VLPESVLAKAAAEMLDYKGSGISVMEMSHRSKEYEDIIYGAEALLRKLMNIPENYEVLFLQGGASTQFAMVPLNLLGEGGKADFINTGTWSKKAISEAKRYGKANVVASSEDKNYSYIPKVGKDKFDPTASYVHITSNNTIEGTRYTKWPEVGSVPLVADMSSNILSEVMDVTKFGLIYAGAQKNIGPAGVTVVIVRKDLLGKALAITPTMLNYVTHAGERSMYNTPPTYGVYVAKLVFEWLQDLGGVPAMEKINVEKAKALYDFLDNSNMFKGTAALEDRSLMNVPFTLPTDELTDKCLKEAKANGLVQLKGHRLVGGLRASIYNAMPKAGVDKLVAFLKKFEMDNK
jgi:phosphoserine aminotransferase